MSSLSPKDRVSLCVFAFADGRRCRTPLAAGHPHFCVYHAQKEARARATEQLGNDLAFFFSGNYLSGCDLSAALTRLIPAVLRGEIKLKLARTVAYLSQTLLQSIHLSQQEYISAFGTDGWRDAVRNSVRQNSDYVSENSNPSPETDSVGAGLQPVSSIAESQPTAPPIQAPASDSAGAGPQPAPPAPARTSDSEGAEPQPALTVKVTAGSAPASQPPAATTASTETRLRLAHLSHVSPEESTLTSHPVSVDSKPLTETLNPLDATLTENRGRGCGAR